MKISVIVPVYNVEDYIEKCIYSITNQTYKDLEIILVDDGSPDNCPAICDHLAEMDDRIKVIHKTNGGLSSARNEGLNRASGKYVMFVDSDDYIMQSACEQLISFANDESVDMAIGLLMNEDGSYYSYPSAADIGRIYNGEDYYNMFNSSILQCSVSSIYRRSFLIENDLHFIEGRYHEDSDFTPKSIIKAKAITYTGVPFYVRCIRDGSITQKKDQRKNLRDYIYLANGLLDYSYTLKNTNTRDNLQNTICASYLSLFYKADIYQYSCHERKEFIEKQLVLKCAKTTKNRIKAILFLVSPHMYCIINRYLKHFK